MSCQVCGRVDCTCHAVAGRPVQYRAPAVRDDREVRLRFQSKADAAAFLSFRRWWERELRKREDAGLSNDVKGMHGPRALVRAEVLS